MRNKKVKNLTAFFKVPKPLLSKVYQNSFFIAFDILKT